MGWAWSGLPSPPSLHCHFCALPTPRSLCGRPLTTLYARCSIAFRRCSRAPGPSRCVLLLPSPSWLPRRGPALSLSPSLQHWLAESARLIAHTGLAVEWVTPLGIPIIQPYHQDSKVLVCAASMPTPTPVSGQASRPITLLPQPHRSMEGSRASPSAALETPASECGGGGQAAGLRGCWERTEGSAGPGDAT